MLRRLALGRHLAALLVLGAASRQGYSRVLSYSPVTDSPAYPAVQFRAAPHFLLVEQAPFASDGVRRDRAVLYDADARSEPRVVFNPGAAVLAIFDAAAWEDGHGTLRLLISTDANLDRSNPLRLQRFFYSPDGGVHWRPAGVPGASVIAPSLDVGGPVVRGANTQLRLGTGEFPFVAAVSPDGGISGGVFAVRADGAARLLLDRPARLLGTDREGARFLTQTLGSDDGNGNARIDVLTLEGLRSEVTARPPGADLQGWITPDGGVYLRDAPGTLLFYAGFAPVEVARPLAGAEDRDLLAVPTTDYAGAWILQRGPGLPTILSRHTPGSAPVEQWRDGSGPQVEALHPSSSGQRLLIQVHRDRTQIAQRFLRDPALAVWNVGRPAPADYHELFLNEGLMAGFVHLDVDAAAGGASFVFDSGSTTGPGGGVSPSAGGGGGIGVLQEFGQVRGSFTQRLILPAAVRIAGRNGSAWRTDLLLRNPSSVSTDVTLRYVPSGGGRPIEAALTLAPREIRSLTDVLAFLGVEDGLGAVSITPSGDGGIEAAAELHCDTPGGRYGTGIEVYDAATAAGARFPVSFAAGAPGAGSRTRVIAADGGGLGASGRLITGGGAMEFDVPPSGEAELSIGDAGSPALRLAPTQGDVLAAALVVDDVTGDPTFFGPDLAPAPAIGSIPAVLHTDGLNGTAWRTDLFLFNGGGNDSSITLEARGWGDLGSALREVRVKAGESRRIDDVLATLFGKSGIARLRYASPDVRVTSRIRSAVGGGGTIGLSMPPLNPFQSAAAGESLEILLPVDSSSRLSLTLVDLADPDPQTNTNRGRFPGGPSRSVIVELDDGAATFPRFQVEVPQAGGLQLADLLRDRPLRSGAGGVMVRVSPSSGLIGAFATRVEDGTGDPAYFGPSLAAR